MEVHTSRNISSSELDINKDLEIEEPHSSSSSSHSEDLEKGPRDVTERGDIEVLQFDGNDVMRDEESGKKDAITRTSTKSSWRDPGPPPDGGWVGWSQGVWDFLFVLRSGKGFEEKRNSSPNNLLDEQRFYMVVGSEYRRRSEE
jgi:hypothetical protein